MHTSSLIYVRWAYDYISLLTTRRVSFEKQNHICNIILTGSGLGLITRGHSVAAQDQDSVTHPVVTAYAEVFAVSEQEALRRLELQNEMIGLGDTLAEKEPDYAGSWIQHEPEFRFSIAFTTEDGEETLQKYLGSIVWTDIIDIEQVK